jgi:hypothetical protein
MADELPKTDKGWQAHLSNARPPAAREWLAIGGGLVVCREPSGTQTFQGRIRRKGERNPSRIAIGAFPAASVAEARRRLLEMKSLAREGRDLALDQRRERAGVVKLRTLGDLIRETLARREGQVAPKTLKIERDLLVGVLAPALGGRLLSDLEPIDFGKAVADYAARLKRGGAIERDQRQQAPGGIQAHVQAGEGWGASSPRQTRPRASPGPSRKLRATVCCSMARFWSDRTRQLTSSVVSLSASRRIRRRSR